MADLAQIIAAFSRCKVLLVGDFMLDRYLIGDAERISPEAPVPVLRIVERQERAGGAGFVALNVASLGGQVHCFGVVGDDADGRRLRELLGLPNVFTDGLLTAGDRPTITKSRLVGLAEHRHRQQMLRVDDEKIGPLAPGDAEKLLREAEALVPHVDVVCLEDYAKGVLSAEACKTLIEKAKNSGKRVVVDPGRSRDWAKYRGASIITPNQAELELGVGRPLAEAEIAAEGRVLAERLELEALIVTLGRNGALLIETGKAGGGGTSGGDRHFATKPRAVYDNTGAGDAVLAMVAVALAAGATLDQAVTLSNIAGGLEVSKFGAVAISREEVMAELEGGRNIEQRKLRTAAELEGELSARRTRGETVVFTNGCFDILHPGHVRLLSDAKSLGSVLVVGLNTDASVRALGKGDDRPIRNEKDRAGMLAALEVVDYVVLFNEPDPGKLIERIAPDVLVKGSDWAGKEVVGGKFVEARGGKVVLIDLVTGYSTTSEIGRIREMGGK